MVASQQVVRKVYEVRITHRILGHMQTIDIVLNRPMFSDAEHDLESVELIAANTYVDYRVSTAIQTWRGFN